MYPGVMICLEVFNSEKEKSKKQCKDHEIVIVHLCDTVERERF